jgi:hypothetical protein
MPKEKRGGNREIRKSKQEKVPPPKPESSLGKQIRATAKAMPGSRDASAEPKGMAMKIV